MAALDKEHDIFFRYFIYNTPGSIHKFTISEKEDLLDIYL